MWKSTKVYTAFLFMSHAFWKDNIEDRVKLLESNVLNFPTRAGLCPSPTNPPSPPQESAPLSHIFCLTGHEWSLTCWAKLYREHWPQVFTFVYRFTTGRVHIYMHRVQWKRFVIAERPISIVLFRQKKTKRSVLSVLILPKESTCNRHINKSHLWKFVASRGVQAQVFPTIRINTKSWSK